MSEAALPAFNVAALADQLQHDPAAALATLEATAQRVQRRSRIVLQLFDQRIDIERGDGLRHRPTAAAGCDTRR